MYQDLMIEGTKFNNKKHNFQFPIEKASRAIEHFEGQIKKMIESKNQCVDEHHADQLMIFMALAKGTSKIRVLGDASGHIRGMAHILNEFLGKHVEIEFSSPDTDCTEISIKGIGLTR